MSDTKAIQELQAILHTGVCEYMLGWYSDCEIQPVTCPKIRKRIKELKPKAVE